MKKLRVLVLMHPALIPPESLDGYSEKESFAWKTEYDVVTTLKKLGHDVRPLGLQDELMPLRTAITDWEPHIVFNLLEEFHGLAELDQHVVSFLELLQVRYTGCNPRGLVLARDKALSKKLVVYHRIRVPSFSAFPKGRKPKKPKNLKFPLIVKCLTEEASLGISQASIVDNDEKLVERINFIHNNIGSNAIVEEFIDGREIYVGIMGNERLEVLPIWELTFENLAPGAPAIATARVKHNPEYQRKNGIMQQPAEGLSPELAANIIKTTKRIYRALEMDGYARIDYRLRPNGELYFLEANPNPEIAAREEFASAAHEHGISYPELLQKMLNLGLSRRR